jgi:hypothetical protein
VSIVDLLLMLAQGDARVVRVPLPRRMRTAAPLERLRTLEARARKTLPRLLALHRRAHILEARAGRLVLKRYLVGVGEHLALQAGGVYAVDGGFAYILDPCAGGIALRDADAEEVFDFAPAGTRLVVAS